jgi:tetratricopeptide (TPR) repeat protein
LENRLDLETMSTGQVSQIMDVVQKTLETHLETEKRAQKQVEDAQERLETSLKQFAPLQHFFQSFQNTIKSSRETIEKRASDLAQTSRHDFRGMASALNDFAQQFDQFRAEFEALEEEPHPQFSARVPYIRGVAAHYANQPEIVEEHLKEVVEFGEPELGEPRPDYNLRVANANYYLGLTESNFGNLQYAIRLFEKANELDLEDGDFLTRVVTAEAYVMLRNFDKAREFTGAVKARLAEMEEMEGPLRNHQLRLRSRAVLIEANMEIIRREGDWQEQAQQLLERVYTEDPQYYYATATLAQVHHTQGDRDRARELFSEAYTTIQQLGHLITVTEARTRVLLLMTAGMCCKHGPQEERWAEEHLDRATDLLGSLPRRGHQICTVFSTLSKQNESSDVIRHHIELIRKGRVLL